MEGKKKALSGFISITLLLSLTVVAFVSFQIWESNFRSALITGIEEKNNFYEGDVEIKYLLNTSLYLKNTLRQNITINSVEADGVSCSLSSSILRFGMNNISLSNCLGTDSEVVKITLYGNNIVLEKKVYYGGRPFICLYNPPESFHGGTGSLADPFQICDCEQLQNMSNYLNANYSLVQNVNCSDTINWNSGNGFLPVGNSTNNFIGNFNGGSYIISNLYINRTSMDYIGLFGYINGGEISNLGITNNNISGANYVGSLIGFSIFTNITNTYSTGNIIGITRVGGLMGYFVFSNIDNSYVTGNIISSGSNVGGLVGSGLGSNSINNSYTTGNIKGNSYTGGLIGNGGGGFVDNSYATGNINGISYTGGLIGKFSGTFVDNSYASGNVNGTSYTGGLIGKNAGIIDNSYATGNVNGSSKTGGLIGYSSNDVNLSYSLGNVNGTGTYVGGLIGSMDGDTDNSYSSGNIYGTSYIGGLIGKNTGNVDNSYTSGNIYSTNDKVGGLIGHNTGTGIVNRSKTSGLVIGFDSTGGLIGENLGLIINTYSTGNVFGTDHVGGLVGDNQGGSAKIINSYTSSNVNGTNSVGGIVGRNSPGSAIINNSFSSGSLNTTGNYIGGSVGENYGLIDNSYWNNVSGNPAVDIGDKNNGQVVIAIDDDIAYFYNQSNSPMNLWSASIWSFSGSALPILN
ncbi:MAG: hypothetical protein KC550_06045 [Nanoarchaeota archaeon]|nr:hypothetical protein [Nanoarchaeota archaeon]